MHTTSVARTGRNLLAASLTLGALALALVLATPLRAQTPADSGGRFSVSVDDDSVARIVPRQPARRAAYAITTRSGGATLLLMDTTIVLQLTDRGLSSMQESADSSSRAAQAADSTKGGLFARVIAGAVLGAIRPMLDHGIEYRLRDLGNARLAAGGRLVLERASGREAFGHVIVDGRDVMEDFAPADAKAFAARVRTARAGLR